VKKRTVFGLPLNPAHLLDQLEGASFCVSYYHRSKLGRQLIQAIDLVGDDQLLMVDNGAFSAWRNGKPLDEQHWDAFARWGIRILDACPQAVMVIPDVIGGSVEENHQLACEFTAGLSLLYGRADLVDRCMMVWHMHEPIDHLLGMVEGGYQYIAIGSSGEYAKVGTPAWHARIREAFAALDGLCCEGSGYRRPWMHLMRGQSMFHLYPFDSCDSCNVAVNHNTWKRSNPGENHVARMAGGIKRRADGSCNGLERVESPAALAELVSGWWSKRREVRHERDAAVDRGHDPAVGDRTDHAWRCALSG
jgi:hypothetical protein